MDNINTSSDKPNEVQSAKQKIEAALKMAEETKFLRYTFQEELGDVDLNYMAWCLRDITESFFNCKEDEEEEILHLAIKALEEIIHQMTPKEIDAFLTTTTSVRGYLLTFFSLPSIRSEGKHKADKCVYILEMENHTVKIGIATDFEKRHNTIMHSSGMKIINWAHTDYISNAKANEIEHICHKHFKEQRLKGEFFNITFVEACKELGKHAEIIDKYGD